MTSTRSAERQDHRTVTDPRPTPASVLLFFGGVLASLVVAGYLGFLGLLALAPLFGVRPDGEELGIGAGYLLVSAAALSLPWIVMWRHTRTRGWAVAAVVVTGIAFAFAVGIPLTTPTR